MCLITNDQPEQYNLVKMNPEVKNLWTAALKSGEYVQGQDTLCRIKNDKPQFCCLGVLTDLYIKQTGKGQWVVGNPFSYDNDVRPFQTESGFVTGEHLSDEVRTWAGLERKNPKLTLNDLYYGVAELNDNTFYEQTFDSIADLINNQL